MRKKSALLRHIISRKRKNSFDSYQGFQQVVESDDAVLYTVSILRRLERTTRLLEKEITLTNAHLLSLCLNDDVTRLISEKDK